MAGESRWLLASCRTTNVAIKVHPRREESETSSSKPRIHALFGFVRKWRCSGDWLLSLRGPIEADLFERRVDFFQRLFTEVGNAEQLVGSRLEQIANGEDAFFLKAIGGSHGESNFGRAAFQTLLQIAGCFFSLAQWNSSSRHLGVPSLIVRIQTKARGLVFGSLSKTLRAILTTSAHSRHQGRLTAIRQSTEEAAITDCRFDRLLAIGLPFYWRA